MHYRKHTGLLSLLFLILWGILLSVVGYINFRQIRNTLVNNGKEQIKSVNHSLNVEYEHWLNERYADGNMFSRNQVFGGLTARFLREEISREEIERLNSWLIILGQNENYSMAVMVDSTGIERLRAKRDEGKHLNLNLNYPGIRVPRIQVGQVLMDQDSVPQELNLYLIVPVYPDPAAINPCGFLVLLIDTDKVVEPMLSTWDSLYPHHETYLILRSGGKTVIINDTPAGKLVAYGINLLTNGEFLEQLDHPGIPDQADVFGKRMIVCHQAVKESNWLVGTSIPMENLLTDLPSRTRMIILASLLLFAIAGLLLMLWLRIQKHNMAEIELASARELEESAVRYRQLFFNNPIPMWIYRISDLKFLEVNEAAIRHYGYSEDEYKSMTLLDIRPALEKERLLRQVEETRAGYQNSGIWKHRLKNGRIIEVEITSHLIDYQGEKGALVLAYDVTERETELKDLWDHAPVGYHSTSPDGLILRMNTTELNWLGYTEEEVVGKLRNKDIVAPAYQEALSQSFRSLIEEGFVKDREIDLQRKDGTIMPVMVNATRVMNPDGSIRYMRVTVVDDTVLKAGRLDQQQKVRMLTENSFDVIFMLDMDLRYTYTSPSVFLLRGYTAEETLGQTAEESLTSESMVVVKQIFTEQYELAKENRLTRRESVTFDAELRCKDGSTVWTEIKAGFIFSPAGKPVGLMGITRDISERRRMTAELIKARDRAEESDHLKSAFLANMSHEIRTPLNAIVGFSGLLDEEEGPVERSRYIKLINSGADQLLQIIDDVLDISRIEAEQITLRPERVRLVPLLVTLERQFRLTLKIKGSDEVSIQLICSPDESFHTITCDPGLLQRIMSNLLDNATKFTLKGSITFGFTESTDPAMIRFYVRDTGIGIRADQQEIIFERFRQAENSLNRRFGGTGLGLSISRSLVEIMGGTMGLSSQEGQGSEFWFTLPR